MLGHYNNLDNGNILDHGDNLGHCDIPGHGYILDQENNLDFGNGNK